MLLQEARKQPLSVPLGCLCERMVVGRRSCVVFVVVVVVLLVVMVVVVLVVSVCCGFGGSRCVGE